MKTNIFLLIIISVNFIFAQLHPAFNTNLEDGKEYYPFNEKIELIFESNVGETIKSIEKLDSLYKVTNVSDDFIYSRTFQRKEDGIYLLRTEQVISTFLYSKEVDITYSEPVIQLPQPIRIDSTWSWSGYQIKNGDTTEVSISGRVIGNETIEILAGKFHTMKIVLFFEEKDGEQTTLYQWLAPGLGSVKTKVIIRGKGIIQFAMLLLGYDEIDSELKEIRHLE